ncbi:MAG TPA: NAD-dependent deacylase [Aggregatilineaceae bacterium]|nr:NAD-dependent deacylase [Aggregatilineaceae bacterium]
MSNESAVPLVARAIQRSQHLVVLTGAGISKESGIPTFRDALEGLWANYDPQLLATPNGFRRNPKLVWEWYDYRRGLIAQTKPNPGHAAIAQLEHLLPEVVVITQNIDGLHQAAGSTDVITLHGNIKDNKCFANCQGDPTYINVDELDWDRTAGPPKCPHCGAWVRPDVVWFEEVLPAAALDRAYTLCEQADVALVVGTSGIVQPAATLPFVVHHHGGTVIEVNPDITTITAIARWHLQGPSGEILPLVVAAMKAGMSDA